MLRGCNGKKNSLPGENIEMFSAQTSSLFIPMTVNFHKWRLAILFFSQCNMPLKFFWFGSGFFSQGKIILAN